MASSADQRDTQRLIERALGDDLVGITDLVWVHPTENTYEVHGRVGAVRFERRPVFDPNGEVERYAYAPTTLHGTDPIAGQDPSALATWADEHDDPWPTPERNSFPYAYDEVAQFFDAPAAPDIVIQHDPAHAYGGNIGQHGSLGVVQGRGVFAVRGPGAASTTTADAHIRNVDIAPTLAAGLGVSPHPASVGSTGMSRRDGLLARQDGDVRSDIVSPGQANRLLVFLLDGLNSNALTWAIERGSAPRIAALLKDGLRLTQGAIASAPTATLANHTTANTGASPGHSGVLHHTWLDRDRQHIPDLLQLDQMFHSSAHVRSDVETLHEAVHRSDPHSFTTATFEFCDRGADRSTFADARAAAMPALVRAEALRGRGYHEECIDAEPMYGFMSSVDECALVEATEIWSTADAAQVPTFSWVSFSLTDEAGHVAGPYSPLSEAAIADTDRRVGALIDVLERRRLLDDTTVVIMSDHGMQAASPDNDGDLDAVLAATGVPHRNVSDGFLYL